MSNDQDVFGQLKDISRLTRTEEQEAEGRDALIRFLDTYSFAGSELPIVDSLCARFGLYPYMSGVQQQDAAEALAVEFHTPDPLAEEGFTFHSGQQAIYQRLMDGESVILSAPTSFGKSAILDALVASNRWSNIVLIVPTIALIDETRRRLARFRSTYELITHASQEPGSRNIYIMTQERFLEIELPDVDFFVIDEFYKLGQAQAYDNRRSLLNLAWNRLKETGAQYYLIGPNIDQLSPELDDEISELLTKTQFRTVVVDVEDRSSVEDQFSDLRALVHGGLDGATLIFTGSPGKADALGIDLADSLPGLEAEGLASEVAEWLGENYDPAWAVVRSLAKGIGIHTGPMPRSVQRIMVRLFNDSMIPTLVCTSTLIEGVNTAAKNVVIYERKIDGQLLDFFTFSNIRGRAGRAFRHFVGNVITYSEPPIADETEVDIPIESQSSEASLATLIQLPEEEWEESSRERLADVLDQRDLSLDVIRRNRGINPERQIAVARELSQSSQGDLRNFSWRGAPTNTQARAVLRLAFDHLLEPRQRRGINFEMLWGKLQAVRNNGGDFSTIVDQQERYKRANETRADVVTEVLRFQRNWMGFTIPSMLRAVQSISAEILRAEGLTPGNYEFLLREVESLYLPFGLVELDEYGLPLPLGRKLVAAGLSGDSVAEMLVSLQVMASRPDVMSRLSTVEQWILQDVVAGLGPGR